MIRTIVPEELNRLRKSGQTVELIDVRTPEEFLEVHVDFAKNIPLKELDARQFAAQRAPSPEPLYVICRSGGRAGQACENLAAVGMEVVNVEGGTLAWQAAGLPVVGGGKVMSLGRQVRIVMGCLILGSSLLAFYSIYWIALVTFFGASLIFSGIANFCGWSPILARMPWNRRNNSATGSPHPHNSFAVPRD